MTEYSGWGASARRRFDSLYLDNVMSKVGSNHPLRIRTAVSADAPALVPLLAEVGFPAPVGTIEARLDAMCCSTEVMLVAVRNGHTLGLLTVHLTPVLHRPTPVGRLTLLAVAEHVRGQGTGRALVEAAEHELAMRGCALVEVISNRRFIGAHAFYERLGYEMTSYKFKKSLTPES